MQRHRETGLVRAAKVVDQARVYLSRQHNAVEGYREEQRETGLVRAAEAVDETRAHLWLRMNHRQKGKHLRHSRHLGGSQNPTRSETLGEDQIGLPGGRPPAKRSMTSTCTNDYEMRADQWSGAVLLQGSNGRSMQSTRPYGWSRIRYLKEPLSLWCKKSSVSWRKRRAI